VKETGRSINLVQDRQKGLQGEDSRKGLFATVLIWGVGLKLGKGTDLKQKLADVEGARPVWELKRGIPGRMFNSLLCRGSSDMGEGN